MVEVLETSVLALKTAGGKPSRLYRTALTWTDHDCRRTLPVFFRIMWIISIPIGMALALVSDLNPSIDPLGA
jgi:hypothetical protein